MKDSSCRDPPGKKLKASQIILIFSCIEAMKKKFVCGNDNVSGQTKKQQNKRTKFKITEADTQKYLIEQTELKLQ